jgi:iron complex transport system substrate-binding protein
MTLLLTLLLALASGATTPQRVVSAASPRRVVSMAPSLTDLMLELGARDRLVGVSRFDSEPELASVARVGGLYDPNLEAVVRLHPDLVLGLDGVAFAPSRQALQAAGLTVLPLRTDTLDEVQGSLRALGATLGLTARADRVWGELSGLLDGMRAQSQGHPRARCAIAVDFRPLVLAGRGSYLDSLIDAAGGENVSPSTLAWPTSSVEQLMASNVEVLIDGGPAEEDAASARLVELLRSRGVRVVRLPSGDLFQPGPRAIRALPDLAKALHASH